MSQHAVPSSAKTPASRMRVGLLTAFDYLEHACAELGAGAGIGVDVDRVAALEQLRAAQDLIRGVGMRLRVEAGLPELPPAKVCAGCGAVPPERGDAYCAGCRSALDRGSNPGDWAPAS